MTEAPSLRQTGRTEVLFRGRKLAYYGGCDYFRLASHPRVLAALVSGMRKHGLNVAASRVTTGNHPLYGKLERALARFFGAEDALLVSSGYVANLVVAQALAGEFSHALLDERAHPSLQDASRFLDCPVLRFRHRDPAHLADTVRRCGPGAKLILLTDGLFAHDGSVALLESYLKALPRDALLLVDDAHGAGVLGRTGKGSLEVAGLGRRRAVQTLTLSKAFGTFGGVVLGTTALRRRILKRSGLFAGSTPLPLPLAQAALEALKILGADPGLRERLTRNASFVKQELLKAGLALVETPGPIVALEPKRAIAVRKLKQALLASGIHPPLIHYPTGPAGGFFRFAISSEHSRAQLETLVQALSAVLGKL